MTSLALRLLAGALASLLGAQSAAAAPRVVVDIAPIQSIVARIMAGVGEPDLIMPPGASPHAYALRPSEAAKLQQADLVVWVGPALTPWLSGPIASLAGKAERVTVADLQGMVVLPVRTGDLFEPDADDPPIADGGLVDGHIWLDPQNAATAGAALAGILATADPTNAATYAANAAAFGSEMTALSAELTADLSTVRGRPFIVFHDAYQYFERRFGVAATASVTLSEGAPPSAARVSEIRDVLREQVVVCAFAEPQFEPKILTTLIEGTSVRTGVLDPLGVGLPPGPDLYPTLLRGLAHSLVDCLQG